MRESVDDLRHQPDKVTAIENQRSGVVSKNKRKHETILNQNSTLDRPFQHRHLLSEKDEVRHATKVTVTFKVTVTWF